MKQGLSGDLAQAPIFFGPESLTRCHCKQNLSMELQMCFDVSSDNSGS